MQFISFCHLHLKRKTLGSCTSVLYDNKIRVCIPAVGAQACMLFLYTYTQHNSRCEQNHNSHPCNITHWFNQFQSHYHVVMGPHHSTKPLAFPIYTCLCIVQKRTHHPKHCPIQVDHHHFDRMWCIGYTAVWL